MKKILPILFVGFHILAFGQLSGISAAGAGLGNSTVAMQTPVALFGNQAGLASLPKFAIAASAQRAFLLSELQSVTIGAAMPTRSGTFGLVAKSFGYEEFKQQKIGLSYARKLWEALSVGAQFDYFNTRIPEYGSRGIFTFEAGVQAQVSKTLRAGAHVFSPAQVELADGEVLPTIFRLGIAWQVSEKLLVTSELEKDLDYKLRWKNGLSYQPVQAVYIRSGFANEPSMLFFGLGFAFGNGFQADMAGSFHQTLGFSPSAGLMWH